MKKIISLLILCSAIAYGTEETPHPIVYFLPNSLLTPTIIYPKFDNGKLTLVFRVKELFRVNGQIFWKDNLTMTSLVNEVKNYSSQTQVDKVGIIVRTKKDYDECSKALREKCGEGIKINANMPVEVDRLKRKVEENRKVIERLITHYETSNQNAQHEIERLKTSLFILENQAESAETQAVLDHI